MDKPTKILLSIIVLVFLLLWCVLLPFVNRQVKESNNLAGIRDYKAGHYDAAVRELSSYLKVHPMASDRGVMPGKPSYAEEYLGFALLKKHQYAEAVNAFQINAKYSAGREKYYYLGVALLDNGNKKEARAKFQEAADEEWAEPMRGRDYALIKACDVKIAEIDQKH